LYNILTEFSTPIKLVKLRKMCLNETIVHQNPFKGSFGAEPCEQTDGHMLSLCAQNA